MSKTAEHARLSRPCFYELQASQLIKNSGYRGVADKICSPRVLLSLGPERKFGSEFSMTGIDPFQTLAVPLLRPIADLPRNRARRPCKPLETGWGFRVECSGVYSYEL